MDKPPGHNEIRGGGGGVGGGTLWWASNPSRGGLKYPLFLVLWKKDKCDNVSGLLNSSTDFINPITPTSDEDRISPYNINTIRSRQVTRIKKNIH